MMGRMRDAAEDEFFENNDNDDFSLMAEHIIAEQDQLIARMVDVLKRWEVILEEEDWNSEDPPFVELRNAILAVESR